MYRSDKSNSKEYHESDQKKCEDHVVLSAVHFKRFKYQSNACSPFKLLISNLIQAYLRVGGNGHLTLKPIIAYGPMFPRIIPYLMLSVYVRFWVNIQTWWAIHRCSFNFQSLHNWQRFESLIYNHEFPIIVVSCRPQLDPNHHRHHHHHPFHIMFSPIRVPWNQQPACSSATSTNWLGHCTKAEAASLGVKFRCFWSYVILRNQ